MKSGIVVHRTVLKRWVRCALLLMIISVFSVSVIMIGDSFEPAPKEQVIYSYNINQKVDYKVYLYDNSFIDNEYIEKDELYMADLIKNIGVVFNYNYSGSKVTPVRYEYDIIGTINGAYKSEENSESQLWQKKYTLLNMQSGEVSDVNNININEVLDVDYKAYNDVVSNFRKELKLSIDASLDIVMTVSIYGVGELANELVDIQKMSISIPLNTSVFEISESYEPQILNNIMSEVDETGTVNIKRLVCGILVSIVGIILFVGLFDKIFNFKKKNPYTIKLNKILKDYGDVIVEIVSQTNIDDLNVIEVKNFNEMIDLEEELRIPIMFYEITEGQLGEFSLIHGNIMYKFILDNYYDK